MRRSLFAFLVLSAVALVSCRPNPNRIIIPAPLMKVETFSFEIRFVLQGELVPESLEAELNMVDILGRFTGGPEIYTATIAPGSPLQKNNQLKVQAERVDGGMAVAVRNFMYVPPGLASAREIKKSSELIRGPLGHSKLGDWLLENDVARFAIQDVAQRELYSVGQYGGNLIDAELIGNEGLDNFLEIQPGLNIETVINAQTVEVVNDGADGTAAIIRTCGPDDLLDFANPSSQVEDFNFTFPPLADDFDLEIEGCTSYALEPTTDPADPQDFVRIETEVFNNETPGGEIPDPLPLFVGDWLNPAGELETVAHSVAPPGFLTPRANGVGPPVTTTIGALGFYGFDEAAGTDYSFVVPAGVTPASFAFISGVLVVLQQDNVLLSLVGVAPSFTVPMGGSRSYTRYFGVGDGSGSNAFDLEQRVNGSATATLSGCVKVGGVPVAGAKVSVGRDLLSTVAASAAGSTQLVSHFRTKPGACPNYSGEIPAGTFEVAASKRGYLYVGGGVTPAISNISVVSGGSTSANFDLPQTGQLLVNAVDAGGQPIPARVTVVGFDPSPPLLKAGPSLPGFGGSTLALFDDPTDRLPFGITAAAYTDASGSALIELEPGVGLYHVYVSRGTEYSAYRTSSPITVTAGNTTVVDAQLARVVDTAGFVSSDFHVHGIRSADSKVSDIHRVESYSAEGVENVIMTDHHVHTDLRPAISDAGLGAFVTATVGEEITTFDYGHFNAYPMAIDPQSPTATFSGDGLTQLSGGSTDWAQAAPPGMDFPSYGAFNATPAEIFALATTGDLSTAATAVQVNHISSHFGPLQIDTSLVPPADLMTDADRAGRRLPDTASAPNLFHHFPALELWNGDNRGAQSSFLNERIGVWFNHLNQGMRTTFIADTDSHRFANLNSAGARTWTASPTDDPGLIDGADVAAAVYAGRAVGGQGIYVQTRLVATDGFGDVADLTLSGDTTMTDAAGNVELEIHVQSPAWAEWDRIEIYSNSNTFTVGSPFQFGATPLVVLDEGDCDPATTGDGNFDIQVTPDVGGVSGADRLSLSWTESFVGLSVDTWFAVVVKGTDGECAPMFPVYPDNLDGSGNTTLAHLVDGNIGENGVLALGATNALYFEP